MSHTCETSRLLRLFILSNEVNQGAKWRQAGGQTGKRWLRKERDRKMEGFAGWDRDSAALMSISRNTFCSFQDRNRTEPSRAESNIAEQDRTNLPVILALAKPTSHRKPTSQLANHTHIYKHTNYSPGNLKVTQCIGSTVKHRSLYKVYLMAYA